LKKIRFGLGDAKPIAFQYINPSKPRYALFGPTPVCGRCHHGIAMIVFENDLQANSELMQIVDD